MRENIQQIGANELQLVQDIAIQTWPVAYGDILKKEQLEYMLNRFYSVSSLENTIDDGHLYYVYFEADFALGFLAINLMEDQYSMKIQKLYVLPNQQGKGIGEKLFQKAVSELVSRKRKRLFLNVNRFNDALQFYLKMGMKISKEENIDIGQGFWMEDYVMEKLY